MTFDPRLRSPKEQPLFIVGVIVSSLSWLALLISIVGALYGVLILAGVMIAHAVFLASVRGNAVRLSEKQMPALYERCKAAALRLGLGELPEFYVMQSGGVLNAFATKLFSRKFVILYSSLVDGCEDPRQLDFVIGHELGHVAAGHLAWNAFLAPFMMIPWLGAAYSRAREYTADRCGMEAVGGDVEASMRGLAVLAAGGKQAGQVDLGAFIEQAHEAGGFWMSVYELVASHPFLCKRVQALHEVAHPGTTRPASRHPLAWPLVPVLGFSAGGTSSMALLMVVYLGVIAAIAVPNFIKAQQQARRGATATAPATSER